MVAASAPERTVAELGLTEASRSNLESLPSQGLASYMVLEPVQAIYIGTFTSIDQASSKRHLVCLPSPRRSPPGCDARLLAPFRSMEARLEARLEGRRKVLDVPRARGI